jgi:hypothetical protein
MKYDLKDLPPMIESFKEKLDGFEIVKIANYTDDPLETATAYVFEDLAQYIEKLHHKTFSTKELAKHWLEKAMIRDDQ